MYNIVFLFKNLGTPHGRDRDTWESGESRDRGRGGDRGRDDRGFDRRRNGFDHGDRRDRRNFGPPIRTNYRLIVENLSSRVSWQDLKNYMRQAGEVTFTGTLLSEDTDFFVISPGRRIFYFPELEN